MKRIVAGILAHVDSGKTTLSEGLLYCAGEIRKLGRVDHRDAFLDTHHIEQDRGITIFSKQAVMHMDDSVITLLDTPGHIDFSAEMERTLQVIDYAILLISGSEGIQSHTETLWNLLYKYHIPTFIFVNKMDLPGMGREQIVGELKKRFNDGCIDFSKEKDGDFFEEIAMCNDDLMNRLALLAGSQSATLDAAYEAPKGTPTALTPFGELFLPLDGLVDVEAERSRITKELEKITKEIAKSNAKLSNASFVDRAPAAVVDQERARLTEWEGKKAQLESMLAALS